MNKIITRSRVVFLVNTFILGLVFSINSQSETLWNSPLKKCWEIKNLQMTTLNLASDNDRTIFLPTLDGSLYALNTEDGSIRWRADLGGDFQSNISKFDKNLLIITNSKKTENTNNEPNYSILKKINQENGIVTQSVKLSQLENAFILKEKEEVFILTSDGKVNYLFNGWRNKKAGVLGVKVTTQPTKIKKSIIFGTSNKTLMEISTTDSNIETQINLEQEPTGNIIINQERIFVGDKSGNIFAIDGIKNKVKWNVKVGGEIVELVQINNKLLASSKDNYIYMFSEKSGKRFWRKRFAGRIVGTKVLNDNSALVLTYGTNIASFIDLSNGKIFNQIILDKSEYFVSPSLLVDESIIISTQKGVYSYRTNCKSKKGR